MNVQLLATDLREDVEYNGFLLSWKAQQFILRNRHISWAWVCLSLHSEPQSEPLHEGLRSVSFTGVGSHVTWHQSRDWGSLYSTGNVGVGLQSRPYHTPRPQKLPCWLRECRNKLLKAQLEDQLRDTTWGGWPVLGFSLGLAVNATLYLWHHRVWRSPWPRGRVASTVVWTWCRPVSCSRPHSSLAAFCVTQYMGQRLTSSCVICCLWNLERPRRHCVSFFTVEDTR